jgi:hypothetical protein
MPKYEDAQVIDIILDFRGPYDGENLGDYLDAVFQHTVKDCPDLGDDQFCFCFDAIWHDVLGPGEAKH